MKQCSQCGQQYQDQVQFCIRDGSSLMALNEASSASSVQPAPASAEGHADPMIGRVIAARYRLLSKLGQGGMGAVYKGEHVKMRRLTAIKILTSELANNQEFITRFQREAEMASQIVHPNAVAIYDFGEAEDGLIYLAMEFADGKPLSTVIRQQGPMPLERVVNITRQAADALNAAHQLGIVHRDFKPDNMILCDKPGSPDWVEVVDFGIAKRAVTDSREPGLTQVGYVLGTPLYMSPEQVAGEPLDARSDLYSLVLVTYQMLTGELPFDGSSTQSQMVKRLLEPPKPLRLARPQLVFPPAVEAVIMRGLARNRDERYSTTKEFAAALENAAGGQRFKQPQGGYTQPQQEQTQPAAQYPFNRPPYSNPATPIYPLDPNLRQQRGPFPRPSAPQPFQPPYPQAQTPVPPPGAYYPQQPGARKSNTKLVLFIILAVIVGMMGACTILAIIGSQMQR